MGRPGLTKHRKFIKLKKLVNSAAIALGSLELIWDSCYESGDDYLGDSQDVEGLADWNGEDGALASALLAAGFIDELDDRPGHYICHDLWHHAPSYVQRRAEREAERELKGVSLSEQRSAAGKKGMEKRWGGPNKQTACDTQPITNESQSIDTNNKRTAPDNKPITNESHLLSGGNNRITDCSGQITNGSTPSTQHPAPSTKNVGDESPTPPLVQTAAKIEPQTTASPPRKKRRSINEPGAFPDEAKRVVRTLISLWPTRDGPDDRPIRIDQIAFAQRVSEIMAEKQLGADTLIQAAKFYLEQKRERYKAPQYFFGPGNGGAPPWLAYVNAALEMEKKNGL